MQTSTPIAENLQESTADLESRIQQLEATLPELYSALCHIYREIDFTQLEPETFTAPYSTHSIPLPHSMLSVTLITTPPMLTIGTPDSHTPGPLHWEHILEVHFPTDTIFVGFCYGGSTGTVEWVSDVGPGHALPALSALPSSGVAGQFYLAKREGIRTIKITSSGEMYLDKLSIGIA